METDILHEYGEQTDWNESFYFNFYDRGSDIYGFMRIGLKPNRNEKMMFCFFMLPDGTLVGTKENVEFDAKELKAMGLNFTNIVPEKEWKLDFEGELPVMSKGVQSSAQVKFGLTFRGTNPMFDYRTCVSGEKEAVSQSVASEHIEQMGTIKGDLTVGEKTYNINGLGERDHSWGVRDWNAPRFWVWITCQFSDSYGFNVTKLVMDKGEVDAGFLYVDGENIPICKMDMVTEYDADDSPNTLFMAMYDKDGIVYGVKADIKKKVKLDFKGEDNRVSTMWETLARFRIDDEMDEIGYGIAEYLIRH